MSGRRGSNSQPTAWKAVTLPLSYFRSVPEEGLEPPCLTAPHPKCGVTANSTIRAFGGGRETRTPTTFRSAVFKTAAIPLCDSSKDYRLIIRRIKRYKELNQLYFELLPILEMAILQTLKVQYQQVSTTTKTLVHM